MKNAEPLSICIVDDDEMFLKSMKYFLQQKINSALQINLFQTGEEFLKSISEKKPERVNSSISVSSNSRALMLRVISARDSNKEIIKDSILIAKMI